MRKKTKKCGIIAVAAAVLLVTALLVTTCSDPMNLGGLFGGGGSSEKAVLRVKMGNDEARTILPTGIGETGDNQLTYRITVVNNPSGGSGPDIDGIGNNYMTFVPNVTEVILDDGDYTVTIDAYTGSGFTDKAATGSGNVTMKKDDPNLGDNAVTIDLELVGTGGTGTLKWDFSTVSGTFQNGSQIEFFGGSTPPSTVNLLTNITGTQASVNEGVYTAEVTILVSNHLPYKYSTIVHIYENLTTNWEETDIDFKPAMYTIAYNANGGFATLPDTAYSHSESIAHGARITAAPTPPPVRAGHVLNGWYTLASASSGNLWVFDPTTGTRVIRPWTLFANWETSAAALGVALNDVELTDPASATVSASGTLDITGVEFASDNTGMTSTITASGSGLSNFVFKFEGTQFPSAVVSGAVLTIDFFAIYENDSNVYDNFQNLLAPGKHRVTVESEDTDSVKWSAVVEITIINQTP